MNFFVEDLNWGVESTGAGRSSGNRVLELAMTTDVPDQHTYVTLYQIESYCRFYVTEQSWFSRLMDDMDLDAYDEMCDASTWSFLYSEDGALPEELPDALHGAVSFLLFANRRYHQEEDVRYAAAKLAAPYVGKNVNDLDLPEEKPQKADVEEELPLRPEWISEAKVKGDDTGAGMHMAEAELKLSVPDEEPVWIFESEMWDRQYELRREPAMGHDEPDWPDALQSFSEKESACSRYRAYFRYLDDMIARL